jgi:hypothetical protein
LVGGQYFLERLGSLINFHEVKVTDGVSRLILPEPTNEIRSSTGGHRDSREFFRSFSVSSASSCSKT